MLSEEWSGRAWENISGWLVRAPKTWLEHAGTFSRREWHIIHQNPWEGIRFLSQTRLWPRTRDSRWQLREKVVIGVPSEGKKHGAASRNWFESSSENIRPWGSKSLGTLGSKNIPKPSHVDPQNAEIWSQWPDPFPWPHPIQAAGGKAWHLRCSDGLQVARSGRKMRRKLVLTGIPWFKKR